ncbi:phage tail-collar fiber domain-containing protein [Vibrio vulnificus]|uniref:phage tail-collar fiber domain-containing protein n=1 Tax=Vibrio vulnificus TaxID=672 RepID=UPI0009C6A5FF|nr:phage tail protein [Vibrio vulnificus]OQK42480.1 hypothetical protein XM74_c11911 [Vibrio vulnificus]
MANTTDKSILTAAGKALLAQLNAEEKPLIIDKMIFANVPNRPEYPQPDDVVPTDHIVHQEQVEQRGRLSADSVIYSTTLTSGVGPFEFNWTGAYCSEYGVLVTIDHHALTPKSADEPGVAGNTLVRSVVLEYKDIAEITNITVDASSWQYNSTPRMKKMDDDVAQAIIDQNGKDWFIDDGFLVTPQASAFNIKAGAGYVSGNRVTLEFDRNVQVPNKPSFIYVDAHREGTPTGEQVTLFNFVVTAEEKDDYIDSSTGKDVKHVVCKIAQVLADGSVSDLRPEGENKEYVKNSIINNDLLFNIHRSAKDKLNDVLSVKDVDKNIGGGENATEAFREAFDTGRPIYMPGDDYLITGSIPLPTGGIQNLKVQGDASKTVIWNEVPDGDDLFVADDWVRGLTMRDFMVNVQKKSNEDGSFYYGNKGLLTIPESLRGVTIDNIWAHQMQRGINLGGKIWGKLAITNYHQYYLGDYAGDHSYGVMCANGANTVFMQFIDIIGGLYQGVELAGGVTSLLNFNVAGSSGNDEMRKPITVNKAHVVDIKNGWVEQVYQDDVGIGLGEAIEVKDSRNVKIDTVNVATGSIYVRNSDVEVDNIYLGNNLSGIKHDKDSHVKFGKVNHHVYSSQGKKQPTDGYVSDSLDEVSGIVAHDMNMLPDIPVRAIYADYRNVRDRGFGATNSSLVNISKSHVEPVPGFKSLQVTSNADYQGIRKVISNLNESLWYTVQALVYIDDADNCLAAYFSSTKNTGTVRNGYISTPRASMSYGEYKYVSLVAKPDANGDLSVDLVCKTQDGANPAKFYVSAFQLVEGFSDVLLSSTKQPKVNIPVESKLANPLLLQGQSLPFAPTNSGLVTFSDLLSGYRSGDRAIKVDSTSINHGVKVLETGLVDNLTYSIVALVKPELGTKPPFFKVTTGSSVFIDTHPPKDKSESSDWEYIYKTVKPVNGQIAVEVVSTTEDGTSGEISFYVDALQLYTGAKDEIS